MNRCNPVLNVLSRQGRRSRGFGLADTLVGFALILSGFFFCSGLIPASERGVRAARSNLLATHLAGSQLEMTRALPFADIASSSASPLSMSVTVNGSTQTVTFTPTITVTSVSQDLKDVTCTVTWKDEANGVARSVFLETLVVKRT